MARNTWWVDYSYDYEFWDEEEKDWVMCSDFDAERFHCPKKDIMKCVKERAEEELKYDKYRNLKVKINDQYITTDCEV